mmetsp:Transcript_99019/g.288781  ORF Transcript_99019/g.288781 Transcript_99019/m.288781 type:complete len:294 (+) Transcript_99019:139-1020(+)
MLHAVVRGQGLLRRAGCPRLLLRCLGWLLHHVGLRRSAHRFLHHSGALVHQPHVQRHLLEHVLWDASVLGVLDPVQSGLFRLPETAALYHWEAHNLPNDAQQPNNHHASDLNDVEGQEERNRQQLQRQRKAHPEGDHEHRRADDQHNHQDPHVVRGHPRHSFLGHLLQFFRGLRKLLLVLLGHCLGLRLNSPRQLQLAAKLGVGNEDRAATDLLGHAVLREEEALHLHSRHRRGDHPHARLPRLRLQLPAPVPEAHDVAELRYVPRGHAVHCGQDRAQIGTDLLRQELRGEVC